MPASARLRQSSGGSRRSASRGGGRERIAVGLWLVLALVAWNGLYDVLLARSTQNYLFRAALHQAGAGPPADLTTSLDIGVRDARWIATLWAGIVLLAGMWTIRMFSDQGAKGPRGQGIKEG